MKPLLRLPADRGVLHQINLEVGISLHKTTFVAGLPEELATKGT